MISYISVYIFFFFKQKTAYEMRISDWSTDVCSSDLTVAKEARAEGKPAVDHACHLVVHGVLHLLGYDHLTDDEAEDMERLEASVLARFGLADPYAEDGPTDGRTANPTTPSQRAEGRSEERRVGKESVRTCRYRWARYN